MKRISRSSFRMSLKDTDKGSVGECPSDLSNQLVMRGLHEFLAEAELSEYHSHLVNRLKVTTVEHLKYVHETDLEDIGMTKPEMRRLKKFLKKEFHLGTLGRIKKALLKGNTDGTTRGLSSSSPTPRDSRPMSFNIPSMRLPDRQIIPAESIQLGRILGHGEFGVVQQGIWRTEYGDTLQVAVKRLSRDHMNSGLQSFLKEANIMQDVDHECIVRMFGVALDTEGNMMLVTELAPMRSLLECIKDPSLRTDLSVTRLCDFALQVCDGMSYLENKRLVHRDLAARNILVFNKNLVKISDLGLSRLLEVGQDYYQSRFSSSLKLPIAWCAPECINFLKFTSASDVWSFAVMLWEFFTYGFQPWAGLNGQQILQAIDEPNCQRLEQPDLCTKEMYKLMKECWNHDPESRPRFSDILFQLPQLKPTQVKALKDYPSPVLEKGYIPYRAGDIIVVINKSPAVSSSAGLVWKGVLANGKSGLFDPTNAAPFIEPNIPRRPVRSSSLSRKDSARRSNNKIRVDMISNPHNDLRHTGHIGYDGSVFGDVSFIANNYNQLPVKGGTGNVISRRSSLQRSSSCNLDRNGHVRSIYSHHDFLDKDKIGSGQSLISQEYVNSQPACQPNQNGRCSPSYQDIEDVSLLSDFKMPDLGSSFDFGPSFMDEVLKALDDKDIQVSSDSVFLPTKSQTPDPATTWTSSTRSEPPLPAPREPQTPTSSTSGSLVHPLRVEQPKDKKQFKVKPMSASEERMVDTALARARELTSHMINGSTQSPPVSPFQGSSFFGEDIGLISRLKNSIKKSTSPKSEHKRTFSNDLEHKGDLDEVTPEAQQAYNMLVVKGSFKEKSNSLEHGHKDVPDSKRSVSRTSSKKHQESDTNVWIKSDFTKESKTSSNSTKISTPASTSTALSFSQASPPSQSINKSQFQSSPIAVPTTVPRFAKTQTKSMFEMASSWPLPDTLLRKEASSELPDIPPKGETKRRGNIILPGFRSFKEPKRIIKSFRTDDTKGVNNDTLKKMSSSFEHSPTQSSQSIFIEHSTASNMEQGHKERSCLANETKTDLSVSNKDFCQKVPAFENNLRASSPKQMFSNSQKQNQEAEFNQTPPSDNLTSIKVTSPQHEPTSQSIRNLSSFERAEEKGKEEVDTNPLRMLKVGLFPLRTTSRGSTGTGNIISRGALALRVPRLNFSRISTNNEKGGQNISEPSESNGVSNRMVDSISTVSLNSSMTSLENKSVFNNSEDDILKESPKSTDFNQSTNHQNIDKVFSCTVVKDPEEKPTSTTTYVQSSADVTDSSRIIIHNILSQTNLVHPLPTNSTKPQPATVTEPSTLPNDLTLNADSNIKQCQLPVLNKEENLLPPRLPPRRSQSLNENSEKACAHLTVLSDNLRRSNSVEEANDTEAPALPPRNPNAIRTPLNTRPRERKFPLQIHLPTAQEKETKYLPSSPQPKHMSHLKSPIHSSPSTPTPLSPVHNSQQPIISITPPRQQLNKPNHHQSPVIQSPNSHNRHQNSSTSDSTTNIHLHHPNSIDLPPLPPAYDLSFRNPSSSDVADSEPTHMLLDLHTLNLPLSLSVNLPPSSDLSIIDEPTHVSLSSLIDNKHSWSTSPLPQSFSPRMTRSFDRPFISEIRNRGPTLYPDSSDNQSPPADLPPAPPTPSYREKLGLEQQKPKMMRSISHTSHHKCGPHLNADTTSPFRGRSSSTNSSISSSHHMDPSTANQSSHRVFNFLHRSYPVSDDIDDAFFAEAPTDPHPYSQTPFHPLIPSSPKDAPQSTTVYNSTSLQLSPDISPYQVSPSVSQPNQSSHSIIAGRQNPSSHLQSNIESNNPHSHTHPSNKHINTHRVSPNSSSTHTYNTVSLPHSSHTSSSSTTTRTSKTCSSSNSIINKPGFQTAPKMPSTKLNNQQQQKTNIFKFPSSSAVIGNQITSSPSTQSHQSTALPGTQVKNPDLSPVMDGPSSSEVSPLMFASYNAACSVSYEDLRQFAIDRQKNCEEIESLLKIFSNQVTVDECMTALETTQWDVPKATKYLQLKKLLSLGVADVHRCKEALCASGWDLQIAAETLLESSKALPSSSSPRVASSRSGIMSPHNRSTTPEIVDV